MDLLSKLSDDQQVSVLLAVFLDPKMQKIGKAVITEIVSTINWQDQYRVGTLHGSHNQYDNHQHDIGLVHVEFADGKDIFIVGPQGWVDAIKDNTKLFAALLS